MNIKDWDRFKHFKTGTPTWIKVRKDLLNDRNWHEMPAELARILVSLWLIAADSPTGELPEIPQIAFRLRKSEEEIGAAICLLFVMGYTENTAGVYELYRPYIDSIYAVYKPYIDRIYAVYSGDFTNRETLKENLLLTDNSSGIVQSNCISQSESLSGIQVTESLSTESLSDTVEPGYIETDSTEIDSSYTVSSSNRETRFTKIFENRTQAIDSEEKIEGKRGPKKRIPPDDPELLREIWDSYSNSYTERYGVAPLRNAKVNSLLKRYRVLVPKAEAAEIAAFYVRHNSSWYCQRMHPLEMLLNDATKLRTEWLTGARMTATRALQIDRTQSMLDVVAEIEASRGGA